METILVRASAEVSARPGLLARLLQLLLTWQERASQRHALQALGQRDLQDLGLSRADVTLEAGKPFWRA